MLLSVCLTGCRTGRHLICKTSIPRAQEATALSVNMSKNAFGKIWLSVGFQLFIGKPSISADHSPLAWENLQYNDLHQGFNWKHPLDQP